MYMKRNAYHFLLVVIILLLQTSCKGKYCYGFPDELTVYLPYSSGENLCFVDNHQDTIILNVQNLDKTRPEYLEWGCKCGCEYYYNVGFKYSNDTMFDVFLWTPDMTEEEMTLRLLQYRDVDYTNGQRNGDSVVFAYSEEFNRENEYAFFDSIVIVKGEGIISFNTLDGQVHHKYHHINTLTH